MSRRFGAALTPGDVARDMVGRANAARDSNRYWEAAVLYAEALRLAPGKAGWHVQCAHMFKEAGDLDTAGKHYKAAAAMLPKDADIALQLGHYYKCAGSLAESAKAYQRALAIQPEWDAPRLELQRMAEAGWTPATPVADDETDAGHGSFAATTLGLQARAAPVAPELAPRPRQEVYHAHSEGIEWRRLGRRERTHWGIMPTLRGVEAVRGFCISATPVITVSLLLNGLMIYRGGVKGGYRLALERDNERLRKYVFNIWVDLSGFVEGRYDLEVVLTDFGNRRRSRGERIVIARPLPASPLADSDGIVDPPDPASPDPIEAQIGARPSMLRPGHRGLLREPPRRVLVQRADQLGDLVVSVPALRRLRELMPQAHIVGLIARASIDLAETLALFDDIVAVDFPDDPWERRRLMPTEMQQALASELASFNFDMAIDLSENASSRLLLPLSGAPVLVGFPSGDMPGLAIEVDGFTHDRWNGHEIVPHTNKLLGFVEWLGAMLRSEPNLAIRHDLSPQRLRIFGLHPQARFALLHDGARLQFSRWPHYLKLAMLLIEQADLSVVMLTDDPASAAEVPEELARSGRFQLIDRRLEFDDFDALVSFCTVFVGNDSGPKHLAALRGARVVSLHMARNNWNEWGQESGGIIISRKLPCAGCLIWHDPEECGKDYVCIRGIKPEEVLTAVRRLIGPID